MESSPADLALKAELESATSMKASLETGIRQVRGFSDNIGTLELECPDTASEISMIASGRVEKSEQGFALVQAIAGDLGHDVEYVIRRERNRGAKLSKRAVRQELSLGNGVSWDDVISAMEAGLEYLARKKELISQTT